MPTNYPSGSDRFFEPSLPEEIPLSQTGLQPGSEDVNGRRARNHVEHHRDLGDAVQALQENAAQAGHDHSGSASNPTKGPRLKQVNTHEDADTDDGLASIHHTLGAGPFQAAPGDHTHDFNDPDSGLLNAPYVRCLSTARPTPTDGLTIYETDTDRMRVYTDFGRGNGARWNILPTANIPIVRLTQTEAQTLSSPAGVFVKWSEADGEDNFAYFNPASTDSSKQNITVTEPGVYQIDLAVQWGTGFIPEMATVVVCLNGAETGLRFSRIQTPNFILSLLGLPAAERSQTIQVSGKLRVSSGDVLSVKCKYGGVVPGGQFVNTYLDADSKVRSRLDMHYVGP